MAQLKEKNAFKYVWKYLWMGLGGGSQAVWQDWAILQVRGKVFGYFLGYIENVTF